MPVTHTQVGIVGGGPAGLLLGHLLHLNGIDSVIIENRSRNYVIDRVRAGVLEQGTVDLMAAMGVGDRLQREGLRHDGLYISFQGQRHRVDLSGLTGKAITIYGQNEVVKDLIDARVATGRPLYFETEGASVSGLESMKPVMRFRHGGQDHEVRCDFIAGCDGFHGVCRPSIPEGILTADERAYPYGWLGILAEAAPSCEELVYTCHERGFALFSMRSPKITRLYFQVPVEEEIDNWSDDAIWAEMLERMTTRDGWKPNIGKIIQKGVTPMRSFVASPMRYGRLFLAGDAAHIVPPTGAKGLNLAASDTGVGATQGAAKTITQPDCAVAKLGDRIPASAIGEPVSAVTLDPPRWVEAARNLPAYCAVAGSMAPVDPSPTAKRINFQVALPSQWTGRAAQLGGGGMNGSVPGLTGSPFAGGFVTYGSDSGHQAGGGGGRGGPGAGRGGIPGNAGNPDDWALSDEAIKNFGYLQLKKTHDAAMVLIERMYGAKPQYNYFIGSSQGGREALTVAQRYPQDYDGVAANVPIVGFSSLMLSRALNRIQERPLDNWVTMAKVNAIRGEFMRQCDKLDGLVDGVINNYVVCREIFDITQGKSGRHPWETKRCPDNKDPNPADTSSTACLTAGQISTLEWVYSRYSVSTLANGTASFGMWVPNTDPSGSGIIANTRFLGQEGAGANAGRFTWMGQLGVTGFLMKNLDANALEYAENKYADRRRELSAILDSTNPDLSAFEKRGGKMIVAIGTNDTLASPGAQLDYYQSVLDKMGRSKVDAFARLYVLPQTGHGLSGTTYTTDGDGKTQQARQIPNTFDRVALLLNWVEKGVAPGKSVTVTGGGKSLPMCSYPEYPKYNSGPADAAGSYQCSVR